MKNSKNNSEKKQQSINDIPMEQRVAKMVMGYWHGVPTLFGRDYDPDPNNCGFGKTSTLPIFDSWVTQNQIDAFHEMTGINPISSEAQMGGSGP